MKSDFDDIRPYNADELPTAFARVSADQRFRSTLATVVPEAQIDALLAKIGQTTSATEFQKVFVKPLLGQLIASRTDGLTYDGLERSDTPSLFVSNHRDIVIDPAFLDYTQFLAGNDSVEIGIGDNLLSLPWVREAVRINKCFVVRRGLPRGEQVAALKQLSAYIRYAICEKHASVWIAQREGRAKDSNDRTQESILKMFSLSGDGTFIDNLKALNIRPVSISYEFDPCDYLKAKELQQRRDDAAFAKSAQDDIDSMRMGITGRKGRVHYAYTPIINAELDALAAATTDRKEQVAAVAALIDHRIHFNYVIYPINRVAYDLLTGENRFANAYSDAEKAVATAYLDGQLAKIDLPNRDEAFLRTKLLEMYANPLKNWLAAHNL